MQVYFEDLQDIPADELEMAARSCRMEEGRAFAPTIGELRAAWSYVKYMKPRLPDPLPENYENPVYVPMPESARIAINNLRKRMEIK